MDLSRDTVLSALVIILTIGVLLIAAFGRRKPFNLSQALLCNVIGACCFAGPILRFGWDKSLVAFLFLFGTTTAFALCMWSAQRRRIQSASPRDDRITR